MSCKSIHPRITGGIGHAIFALLVVVLQSACTPSDSLNSSESANSFSLKDWLCTITPGECHGDVVRNFFNAPPDTFYEKQMGDTKLRVSLGFVQPLEVEFPNNDSLFLNAMGADMQARNASNKMEFMRAGHPALIRFRVGKPNKDWNNSLSRVEGRTSEHIQKTIQGMWAAKRYPDEYGLEHWGTNYEIASTYKPCEFKNQKPLCGTNSQDDIYRPIKPNGALSYITCPTWLALSKTRHTKYLTMTWGEIDEYHRSGQEEEDRKRDAPTYVGVGINCTHSIYYEKLHAGLELSYHLALLPHWKQIEDRTRAILDAALVAPSAAKAMPR